MAFDFMLPLDNLPNAEILASMLEALDDTNWTSFLRMNSQDLPQAIDAWYTRDSNEQAPRCIKIELQEGTLILIQGVKRETTALRLMQAYGERPRQQRPAGINAQVLRAVDDMYNDLIVNNFGTRANILIAGHSYGGAVAVALASEIKFRSPLKNVRVVTFGAPKPGNQRYAQDNQTLQVQRYWNVDDPVPMIAPTRSQARAAHAMLPHGVSSYWHDASQVGNGIEVWASGNAFRGGVIATNLFETEINLIGWATGVLVRPVQNHSIHEYYLRLVRANAQGISIGTDRPGTVYRARRSDQSEPQPVPEEVPAVVAAVAAVQVAVEAERTVPMPATFVADQRAGRWGVYRGAELVTFAATSTRARSIARTGNSILRDMQARGTVNEEAVRTVLAAMLR